MRMSARRSLLAVSLAALVLTLATDGADARRRVRQKVDRTQSEDTSSDLGGGKYAAYVVDDNTGKVLFARNEDAPRHPASLTKMLTLYILFEDLERGKVKLDTEMGVSAKAASQAPTKLGLRPGQTIEVEDAIKSLVTLSANDASMVIAEHLAGSQDAFADRMNATARRIGMTGSRFYNPNGLPDDRQITTAHDMVVLGSALSERFPTYYRYFSTRSFEYGGRVIGNHNRLLGRIEGIDGIKTGYTQASGFNLVSSLRRDGRHLVAAVMGGPTGGARDRHMAKLLETYLPQASGGSKAVSLMSGGARSAEDAAAKRKIALIAPIKIAADPDPAPKPSVERGAAVAMARAVLQPDSVPAPVQASAGGAPIVITPKVEAQVAPQAQPMKPVVFASAAEQALPPKNAQRMPQGEEPRVKSLASATISHKEIADLLETASVNPRLVGKPAVAAKDDDAPQPGMARVPANAAAQSGWLIQIGAFDREGDAKAHLSKVQGQLGSALKGRTAYTESVAKGSGNIYRARFAGFADAGAANAACSALKKKDISCLAMKR
jgi:D-alanyl-D-alanine carboxypeptidase